MRLDGNGQNFVRNQDFTCTIPKNRKDKPTFRTMVNQDKVLNDLKHRGIEKRNEYNVGNQPNQ